MNFDNEDFRYVDSILYRELQLDVNPNNSMALREYFCRVMRDSITSNEITIVPHGQGYLVTVGLQDRYIMQGEGIFRCNTFEKIISKYIQNCSTSLNLCIQEAITKQSHS